MTVQAAAAEGKPAAETAVDLGATRFRPAQVDVVFVLDVTGSMGREIRGVQAGIVDFARELQRRRLDARVGLLAFRDRPNGEEAEQLRFEDGAPFTRDVARFAKEVGRLEAKGGGDRRKVCSTRPSRATRLPFRPEAARVLLLICDDVPKLPDKELRTPKACNDLLRARSIAQLHVVVRRTNLSHYEEIREGIKGQFFNLDAVRAAGPAWRRHCRR
ncbi:MAG: vWA domain-containing protein [Gemmataceae bacterium]